MDSTLVQIINQVLVKEVECETLKKEVEGLTLERNARNDRIDALNNELNLAKTKRKEAKSSSRRFEEACKEPRSKANCRS